MQEQEQTDKEFTGEFAYNYITEQITDEMQKVFEDFMESLNLINFNLRPENQPEISEQCLELEKAAVDAFYPLNGISYDSVKNDFLLKTELLLQMRGYVSVRKKLKSGVMTKEHFFESFKRHG